MPAALLFVFLLIGCRETLYPRVSTPSQSPTMAWGRVLAKAVDEQGDVDYAFIRANRRPLDDYVAWVARDTGLHFKGPANAHAFWLNTYNALAIYQVLERGISKSVCEIPTLWPGRCSGPTWATDFEVGGYRTSLWEIYNERIVSGHQDYRDLACMNPGVRSGPPVHAGLYTPDGLKEQLNGQMAAWMRHKRRGVRVEGDVAVFNEIFDRYSFEVDLFTDGRDLCDLARLFTVGEKAAELQALSQRGCPHRFARFDRRLNRVRSQGGAQ